jgi:hypothetical protein
MKVVSLSQTTAPPSSPPKVVRDRGLFSRKLSKAQLALLGAEIKEGSVVLTDLSIRQFAAVLGVSMTYLVAALGMSPPERAAVRQGLRLLVEPHPKASVQTRLARIIGEIGVDGVLSLLAAGEQKSAA